MVEWELGFVVHIKGWCVDCTTHCMLLGVRRTRTVVPEVDPKRPLDPAYT